MKISTKTKILSLSALTLSLSSLALANDSIRETIIKPDLSHTVQSIEKIIFSSQGIQGDTSAIPLSNQQGVIHLEGKFSATSTEEAKTNSNNGENSILIGGKENQISGANATIIVGKENNIEKEGEKSMILGGKNNTGKGKNSTIVGGYKNKTYGELNTIIGGQETKLSAQKNISLGANDSKVNGSHNTIAGSNIKIENTNVKKTFVWSDNKKRRDTLGLDPKTSNTLYLRSENGVMINTATPSATLSVKQMVQLGDEAGNCSPDKIGTLIFRNGCFYACSDGQSWDNLAGTAECDGSGIKTITFDIPTPADRSKRVELGQKAAPQGPQRP
ncbi:hypothetical protein HXK74_02185 [Candidatus Gracilibacteria bacterium]|nr:hypothetical protein [Candidatus Gracilibacteria bacterium]